MDSPNFDSQKVICDKGELF